MVPPLKPTLDARTLFFLTLPPMMWAGNAVVGRLVVGHMPPVMANAVRWALVAALMAPWAWHVLRQHEALHRRAGYLMLIGALGVGSYNSLQYMALRTSSPLNVTLIGASMPMWMMLVGVIGFGQRATPRQLGGALLSCAGVVLVMSQGSWAHLREVRLVPGDLLMLLAALTWSIYSWLLVRKPASMQGEPAWNWAEFLWLQVLFGTLWATASAGVESAVVGHSHPWPADAQAWGTLVFGLLFIAIGPSILAYWGWGQGVRAVGPTVAAFFSNLTPVFAAVWAWALLGTAPQWYHPCALVLIGAGIVLSSSTRTARPSSTSEPAA